MRIQQCAAQRLGRRRGGAQRRERSLGVTAEPPKRRASSHWLRSDAAGHAATALDLVEPAVNRRRKASAQGGRPRVNMARASGPAGASGPQQLSVKPEALEQPLGLGRSVGIGGRSAGDGDHDRGTALRAVPGDIGNRCSSNSACQSRSEP